MFKKNLPATWLVPIFSLSGIAAAQTPAPASPSAEAAKASPLTYRSAFEGYKPYTDDKLLNWKEVNDTTGRIGGWRVYAKEARQPDDKAPAHDMSKMSEPKTEGGKP
ncbi:MAG: hypothetical protein V4455_03385 [Pseudomonadota bacterium]|uniref:Uncharacterized protein n=1 Tax=Polaromonas aquatica TaxID=332657 RepID=A0ABW1TYD2_9BURK